MGIFLRFLSRLFVTLLSLPKIFYINFKFLPFSQAIRLPIYVHYNTELVIKGRIIISDTNISLFTIIFGKGGSHHISYNKSKLFIYEGGRLILDNRILFSSGFNICIEQGATVKVGESTSFNRNCSIFCKNKITIGKNNLFGWNCSLRDNDGHSIYYQNNKLESEGTIVIEDNCWITADSVVLKNSFLASMIVVATGSLVNKRFNQNNILIAGRPARIVRDAIRWEK